MVDPPPSKELWRTPASSVKELERTGAPKVDGLLDKWIAERTGRGLWAMMETRSQTEPVAHARFDQCHLLYGESAQKALRLNSGNRNGILDQKGPWF